MNVHLIQGNGAAHLPALLIARQPSGLHREYRLEAAA